MKKFRRICVIVLDGFGVGASEDAEKFGDTGSNTFGSLLKRKPQIRIPNLNSLGLSSLLFNKIEAPLSGYCAKMREISAGKDTTTGHWEMMGLPVRKAFDTFPQGFPQSFMEIFVRENQLPGYLGNFAASGTQIIFDLGEEHLRTGKPIVYTSADSVFQIAAHEKYFGLDRLYEVCERTRSLLNQSSHLVGRVIARPFIGEKQENFSRTAYRRDFSIKPLSETVLTRLKENFFSVTGVGKIPYIYDGEGITQSVVTHSDDEAIEATCQLLHQDHPGLIFTNLNDLDTLYGHRRNVDGYIKHLEEIDLRIPKILKSLKADDLLMITSDHGNDPSFKGTDHTREFVPLLTYSPSWAASSDQHRLLGIRGSFCDLGESILENFDLDRLKTGKSFLDQISS